MLSLENPGFIDWTRLGEYRKRLRRGDHVYIGLQGTTKLAVAWLGARREIAASEFCAECKTSLNSSAMLIYDCRSAPNLREHRAFDELLAALAEEAAVNGIDAFIRSSALSDGTRKSIEAAGFQIRHRMIHLKIFHWIHRGWILRSAN
jgi:hypothetical protein